MSTRGVVHRVYQHRDGTSQRRRGCILLSMLVRPSARARTRLAYKTCLRTPQREDAAPTSPEARRQFTRTEPSPEGVWGLCNVAPVSEERTPNGCAAPTRRRGSTGKPNPVRQSARLAETAIARETAARRRRGAAARSLPLSVPLSPLSSFDDAEHRLSPVRGPPACSSAGPALRAAGRRPRRPRLCAKNHIAGARRPAAGR